MATNITMKIEGITGESRVEGATGEIDILHYGVSSSAHQRGHLFMSGQSQHGKAEIEPLTFSKLVDKSTPQLLQKLTKGDHIPTVTITVRAQIQGDNKVTRTITLSDALLVSQAFNCAEGMENETFTLCFKQFKFDYTQYDNSGKSQGKTSASYTIDTVKTA
jgi:type VI secretion system secreted protein Hcp